MHTIQKVKRSPEGDIVAVQLDNGTILDLDQAVKETEHGNIAGVAVSSRLGNKFLRSIPDDNPNNDLDNLPEF